MEQKQLLSFEEYQRESVKTKVYGSGNSVVYPLIGLNGEVGEVCEKYKKHLRDGTPLDLSDMVKELGDVLWYLSAIADDLGISLQDIAEGNIEKLKRRKEEGTIHGNGDNR